ncbi:MAG: lipid-A-disaccharide synthase [Thermodesulfobacteriota bacterium]
MGRSKRTCSWPRNPTEQRIFLSPCRVLIPGKLSLRSQFIKRICLIAGEASGDLHGAALVNALRESGQPVSFFGLGGPLLESLGVEMVCPPPLNVVGFIEVVLRISHLVRAYQKVKQTLYRDKPDLIILIDYPDMNLRLARAAHEAKIPVLYYISPQVWAWRKKRVKTIARYVDRLAVILPFEVEFYNRHGIRVDFVGHPLLDGLPFAGPGNEGREGASASAEVLIGLFPGSRPAEVKAILPTLLETAEGLSREYGSRVRFVLPVAGTLEAKPIREAIRPFQERGVRVELATEDSQTTLSRCQQAIVASGTVTLEAALLGVPLQIVYKVSTANYWIARLLIDVPYVGLVNWVAGKKIIPEFLQKQARPEAIGQGVRRYLEDPAYYEEVRQGLMEVGKKLGRPGASRRVAQMAWEMMGG